MSRKKAKVTFYEHKPQGKSDFQRFKDWAEHSDYMMGFALMTFLIGFGTFIATGLSLLNAGGFSEQDVIINLVITLVLGELLYWGFCDYDKSKSLFENVWQGKLISLWFALGLVGEGRLVQMVVPKITTDVVMDFVYIAIGLAILYTWYRLNALKFTRNGGKS